MKTAIPVYTNLVLQQAAAYKSLARCTDLDSVNASELFMHVRVTNGQVPPAQGVDMDLHYAFSPFDFRADLANVPDICVLAEQVFELSLQTGSGKIKTYSTGPVPVEGRFLYTWLAYPELNSVHGATVILDISLVPTENSVVPSMDVIRKESPGLTNWMTLKVGAGTIYNLYGYNSKYEKQFIQLFDRVGSPPEGTVPIAVFGTSAADNFGLDVPVTGIPFTNGLIVANSLVAPQLQLGLADCFFYATLV